MILFSFWLVSKICQDEKSGYSLFFLPVCFWQATWWSDSWHPCTNRLSVQSYWVRCISVLQRLGVPSPSFVFALHLISHLRLRRSQVSLFRWASPHINTCITLTLPTILTLQVQRKGKGLEGLCTCVVAIHREREMCLLRPQMQMEVDFSFMLEGSFPPESN